MSYSSLFLPSGRIRHRTATALRRDLQLNDAARLCLVGVGRDELLERMWKDSRRSRIWEAIADLSFEFVTTSTFSVWDKQPRFDQIFNQERNLHTYSRFTRLGIPTVPFLFCAAPADYQAARNWLKAHSEVRVVAALGQFYRRAGAFEQYLHEVREIRDRSPRPLDFLIMGCAAAAKIRRVFFEFPHATIVTGKPVHKAISGDLTQPDLSHVKAHRDAARGELMVKNISQFFDFCEVCRSDALRRAEI